MGILRWKKAVLCSLAIVLMISQLAWAAGTVSAAPSNEILVQSNGTNIAAGLKSFAYNDGGTIYIDGDGALWTQSMTSPQKRTEADAVFVAVAPDNCSARFIALDEDNNIWVWHRNAMSSEPGTIVNLTQLEEGLQPFFLQFCSENGGSVIVAGMLDGKAVMQLVQTAQPDVMTVEIGSNLTIAPNKMVNIHNKSVLIGNGSQIYAAESGLPAFQPAADLPESANYVGAVGPQTSTEKPIVLVASDSSNIFVADQIAGPWHTVNVSEFGVSGLNSVAYGNGYYIAVGDGGIGLFSKNGKDWDGFATNSVEDIVQIEYLNYGSFRAIGSDGALFQMQAPYADLQTYPVNFDQAAEPQVDVTFNVFTVNAVPETIVNTDTELELDSDGEGDYKIEYNEDAGFYEITIRKEYLALQGLGPLSLQIAFNQGHPLPFEILIYDSSAPAESSITPTTASFDKNTSEQQDVQVELTLNGNTFDGIELDGTQLALLQDYGIAYQIVTLHKAYLATLPTGNHTFDFIFSGGPSSSLTLTISDSSDDGGDGGNGGNGGNGGYTPSPPVQQEEAAAGVEVLVNGKAENAGTATIGERDGQSVLTIALDEEVLAQKLDEEQPGAVVTIPVTTESEVVIGQLNGQMVKNMENKQAILEIKTGKATYTVPAGQINMDELFKQFEGVTELKDIIVHIEIAEPLEDIAQAMQDAAANGSFSVVVPPVAFAIKATFGDITIEVTRFNAYVERTVAIPGDVDPDKITTGVVLEADGSVRHVPTRIHVVDGQYFAHINSLTNSVYSVIWHPYAFADAAGHWAEAAINDMGSRLVVNGVDQNTFGPDQSVTRAEFAAALVRGLGLRPDQEAAGYADVHADDWHHDAISAAKAYGLLVGFEDGTFRPQDLISREQAMTALARAMQLTGLKARLQDVDAADALKAFADVPEVSTWARSGIADSLAAGLITGRTPEQLAPKANMTRAEVAAIVQRLLQSSGLI